MRNPYTGAAPQRVQTACPCCHDKSGVFFANKDAAEAWFHCTNIRGKNKCGVYFIAAAPPPLVPKAKVA